MLTKRLTKCKCLDEITEHRESESFSTVYGLTNRSGLGGSAASERVLPTNEGSSSQWRSGRWCQCDYKPHTFYNDGMPAEEKCDWWKVAADEVFFMACN